MAEPTEPQSPVEPDATAEPVVVEPVSASEHLGVEPDVPEVDEAEVVDDVAVPVVVEPVAVVEPVTAEPVAPVAPEPPREVVYVQAPTPPKLRHNRGFGVLISLLGAVAFALLYIGVVAILVAVVGASVDASLAQFVMSMSFWVPVAVYAVMACVFALIVNRAAWWAHVLGSLFVAALTYGISGGIILLALGAIGMTPDEGVQKAAEVFGSPLLIAALVIARETSLWFGLAIAARGRRVKERNANDRAAFEQSVADRRAEYERAHPSA
ncbi:MAG: hypothetical protein J0H23_07630 [Micrococcales bacterium]|nr:hypothetical protein [Micrococcales bacterium]OJX67459.1 MAG: hypothetical protein BGO94_01120 [Micrococcales bacterium 72-143]